MYLVVLFVWIKDIEVKKVIHADMPSQDGQYLLLSLFVN